MTFVVKLGCNNRNLGSKFLKPLTRKVLAIAKVISLAIKSKNLFMNCKPVKKLINYL